METLRSTSAIERAHAAMEAAKLANDFEAHEKAQAEIAAIQAREAFNDKSAEAIERRSREQDADDHAGRTAMEVADALRVHEQKKMGPALVTFADTWRDILSSYDNLRAAAERLLGRPLNHGDRRQVLELALMLRAKLHGLPQRQIMTDPNPPDVDQAFAEANAAIIGELRVAGRIDPRIAKALKDAGL